DDWKAWAGQREQWAAKSQAQATADSADSAEQRRLYLAQQRRERLDEARLRREERRLRSKRLPASASWLVIGIALLSSVACWALLSPDIGNSEATLPAIAVALTVLGLGILIAGLFRRRALALTILSMPLALSVAVAIVIPAVSIRAGGYSSYIDRDIAAASQSAGQMELVLDGNQPVRDQTLELGAGEINITLVNGARVDLDVQAAVGEIVLGERMSDESEDNGWSEDSLVTVAGMWQGVVGSGDGPVSTLHIRLGAGQITINDHSDEDDSDKATFEGAPNRASTTGIKENS
ncbi:MAG: hypothetical protein ACTJHU_09500, partial [Mycetocola sp.]